MYNYRIMVNEVGPSGFDFGTRSVSRLVRNLHDPKVIGRHPLAKLAMVGQLLSSPTAADSDVNRGQVLIKVIEDITKRDYELWPNNIPAKMLYEIVINGKTRQDLEKSFILSNRSILRYARMGYALLGRHLMSTHEEASKKGLNLVEPIAKETQDKGYEQYLRQIHPDWKDREIKERLAVTLQVLEDFSGFVAQSIGPDTFRTVSYRSRIGIV